MAAQFWNPSTNREESPHAAQAAEESAGRMVTEQTDPSDLGLALTESSSMSVSTGATSVNASVSASASLIASFTMQEDDKAPQVGDDDPPVEPMAQKPSAAPPTHTRNRNRSLGGGDLLVEPTVSKEISDFYASEIWAGMNKDGVPKICQANCSFESIPFDGDVGILCLGSDGHGPNKNNEDPHGESGEGASALLVRELPVQFLLALEEVARGSDQSKKVTADPVALEQAVRRGIDAVQKMMVNDQFVNAGATLVGFVRFNKLLVHFNTGDSALVLARPNTEKAGHFKLKTLSQLHNCTVPEEADRVQHAGGIPDRDYGGIESNDVNSYIPVTRSHGDLWWHKYGLSAEPYIGHVFVKEGDHMVQYSDSVAMPAKSVITTTLMQEGTLLDGCKATLSAAAALLWAQDSSACCDDSFIQVLTIKFDYDWPESPEELKMAVQPKTLFRADFAAARKAPPPTPGVPVAASLSNSTSAVEPAALSAASNMPGYAFPPTPGFPKAASSKSTPAVKPPATPWAAAEPLQAADNPQSKQLTAEEKEKMLLQIQLARAESDRNISQYSPNTQSNIRRDQALVSSNQTNQTHSDTIHALTASALARGGPPTPAHGLPPSHHYQHQPLGSGPPGGSGFGMNMQGGVMAEHYAYSTSSNSLYGGPMTGPGGSGSGATHPGLGGFPSAPVQYAHSATWNAPHGVGAMSNHGNGGGFRHGDGHPSAGNPPFAAMPGSHRDMSGTHLQQGPPAQGLGVGMSGTHLQQGPSARDLGVVDPRVPPAPTQDNLPAPQPNPAPLQDANEEPPLQDVNEQPYQSDHPEEVGHQFVEPRRHQAAHWVHGERFRFNPSSATHVITSKALRNRHAIILGDGPQRHLTKLLVSMTDGSFKVVYKNNRSFEPLTDAERRELQED